MKEFKFRYDGEDFIINSEGEFKRIKDCSKYLTLIVSLNNKPEELRSLADAIDAYREGPKFKEGDLVIGWNDTPLDKPVIGNYFYYDYGYYRIDKGGSNVLRLNCSTPEEWNEIRRIKNERI